MIETPQLPKAAFCPTSITKRNTSPKSTRGFGEFVFPTKRVSGGPNQ